MSWRLGVVGHPIEHSLSPTLHRAGLAYAHLDGTSERYDLSAERAPELATLLGGRFDALSVTMPLKFVAGAYCDELDDVAARIGSVNTMVVRDGRVIGASTDGAGFVDALRLTGLEVEGLHVVVLGAGGSARAIVDALVESGVAHVDVVGRSPANVAAITERYACVDAAQSPTGPVDLVVNTVPVSGRDEVTTLVDGVHAATLAVDITYEPRVSAWSDAYDQAGCRSVNGLAMLACQAALQMQWWWGVEIDPGTLLEAIT